MIGGNIPGLTQTVSIAIYDNVQALDYSAANRMAVLLMAFSFVNAVDHVLDKSQGLDSLGDES